MGVMLTLNLRKPDMDHIWIAEAALLVGVGVLVVIAWWPVWARWWSHRDERFMTRDELARRRVRDFEHDIVVNWLNDASAEKLLRRMLIDDLRQIRARRQGMEALGIDFEWPGDHRRRLARPFWKRDI